MFEKDRGQIDTSVTVGVVVVVAIIAAAVFGVYYLGFVRPNRLQLEELKDDSVQELNSTLGSVDTSRADIATTEFKSKIKSAESTSEVEEIMSDVSKTYQVEKKREELLDLAKETTEGSFYELDSLRDNFRGQIESKETLSGLEDLEDKIETTATQEWKDLQISHIKSVSTEEIVMRTNNSPSWFEVGLKENEAIERVNVETWEELKTMSFEEMGSYEIPITFDLEDAPTLVKGATVDVRIYKMAEEGGVENEWILGEGLNVEHLMYDEEDLGSIDWQKDKALSGQDAKQSTLSTEIVEEIKSQVKGHDDANVPDNWGKDVVVSAMNSNIELSEVEVTCLVNVPAQGDAMKMLDYVRSDSYEVIPISHVD